MVRNKILGLAAAVALILGTAGIASADQAATSEMPEAFAAMGLDNSTVLTTSEADAIRGEGGCLCLPSIKLPKLKLDAKVDVDANVKVLGLVKVKADVKVKARVGLKP